jgi:two-component system, OmpR family, phosphate regulon sensor histidine kinase PhoR
MKARNLAWVFGGMAAVMLFLTLMMAVAFFLTSLIYGRAGVQPAPLFAQIVNSLLGLFLSFLILSIVGRVFSSRLSAQRMGWEGQIIQALERIAQGDFSVRLEENHSNNGLIGELTKSVNSMAVELDTMEKMRQEFISNVSHEIQSPLTSIRGFALALRSNHLSPEEHDHYLKIIEAESQRLSRITDNLLKLASLESKEFKLEVKPYRLDKQIRNLILACEPQWTAKQIDMDVSLDEITIAADEDLLSQVWINLIHNGIKFTPAGGKVCVDLRQRDDQIEFRITDTGIGIPELDQARVFERFYKADKSRRRSTEGSGLGLAITKKIVEMHQGTIALESTLGAGTTFIVTLPNGK